MKWKETASVIEAYLIWLDTKYMRHKYIRTNNSKEIKKFHREFLQCRRESKTICDWRGPRCNRTHLSSRSDISVSPGWRRSHPRETEESYERTDRWFVTPRWGEQSNIKYLLHVEKIGKFLLTRTNWQDFYF